MQTCAVPLVKPGESEDSHGEKNGCREENSNSKNTSGIAVTQHLLAVP